MSSPDVYGPIDFLVLQYPRDASGAPTAEALVDLLARGVVRLYDLLVVERDDDGGCREVDLTAGGPLGDLRAFRGARSGLLGADDLDELAAVIDPGTVGVVVLYENAWAVPFVAAARAEGAEAVAGNRITAQQIMDALDALEPTG